MSTEKKLSGKQAMIGQAKAGVHKKVAEEQVPLGQIWQGFGIDPGKSRI